MGYKLKKSDKSIKTFKVNMKWINAALSNPSSVYGNIAHEIGHWDYGETFSRMITRQMLAGMSEKEKSKTDLSRMGTAYHYPETEIFAERREYRYYGSSNKGDDPAGPRGLEKELKKIKKLYEPGIAKAIVLGLRRRVKLDNSISKDAREMFDPKGADVFKLVL
ncbi:MAG: hypothetical protein PVF97_00025 [Desulfobacterales bacterium]|jgi:hypothetical protein